MSLRLSALVSQKSTGTGSFSSVGFGSPEPTADGDDSFAHGSDSQATGDRTSSVGLRVVNLGERGRGQGRDLTNALGNFDVDMQGFAIDIGDGIDPCFRICAQGGIITVLDSRDCDIKGLRHDLVRATRVQSYGLGHEITDTTDMLVGGLLNTVGSLGSAGAGGVLGAFNLYNTFVSFLSGIGIDCQAAHSGVFGEAHFLAPPADIFGGKCSVTGFGNTLNVAAQSDVVGELCQVDGKACGAYGTRVHALRDHQRAWNSPTRNEGLGDNQWSLQPEYFTTADASAVVGYRLPLQEDRTYVIWGVAAARNTTTGLSAGFEIPKFTVRREINGPPIIEFATVPVPSTGTGDSGGAAALYDLEVDETTAGATIGPDAGTGFEFTAQTIIRNDGGDWIADGLKIGDKVEIKLAEDAGNNGFEKVTAVTATVLTFGAATFTLNATDTAATFDPVVGSIDFIPTGDPAPQLLNWELILFYVEVKGTA